MADMGRMRVAGPTFLLPAAVDFQNFTLDASTDAVEWILQADEAATITAVGFRYGARTGTPPTYIVSIQGVDASGNPDGTILGGGSPASATFTPPASTAWDGTWRTITLANSIALTRGQVIAIVITYSSGTIDGSNSSSFSTHTRSVGPQQWRIPYLIQNNAGARTRVAYSPNVALYSASETFIQPISATSSISVRNDTGVEVAVKFTLPAGAGDTFKIAGVAIAGAFSAAASLRVQLYDTDGTTALQTISWDTDALQAASLGVTVIMFNEATLATLSFGSAYRIGIFGLTSGIAGTVAVVDANSAQDLAALPGGSAYSYSSRSGGTGAWADLDTRRPLVDLIFDDWTEPSGGGGIARLAGGGLVH